MVGPLKKLEWTDWTLAVSDKVPIGYSHKKFIRSQVFSSFHRRNLFENEKTRPAIYEVGIKFPGYYRKRIYTMYFRTSKGCTRHKGLFSLYILRQKKVRMEVSRLLDQRFVVYMRRGVAKGKDKKKTQADIIAAAKYLDTFDYAWRKHGRSGHRKFVKNKVLLSDNAL